MRIVLPLLVAAFLVSGCGGGKEADAGQSKLSAVKLVGVWPAKLDVSGLDQKSPAAANIMAMARSFDGQTDLEFKKEDAFTLCAGGYLIEGTATRSGPEVLLSPATVNGLTLEKAKAAGIALQESLLRDMRLVLKKEDLLWMAPGEYGERLTFERWLSSIAAERQEGEAEKYVGLWKVSRIDGLTSAHRQRGFDYVLKRTALYLQQDGQFQMRFTYRFLGTWELVGGKMVLKYPSGSMSLAAAPDGTLRMTSPDGKLTIVLAKG